MDLIKNLGISYMASYLIQGNQLERCKTSAILNSNYTELIMRSDGKNSDVSEISKIYNGKIIYHVPAINPDLSNLNAVNNLVKNVSSNKCDLITINASNLSLDLFEWSTLEEQKKYFLNIVTAIATLASNKVKVAIENLKSQNVDSMFGGNITQITDILTYARKLLVKDFGFSEEESEEYVVLSLNVDNIDSNDDIEVIPNWFEVFNDSIKIIKMTKLDKLNMVIDILKEKDYDIPIMFETKSELEEIKEEYTRLKEKIIDDYNVLDTNITSNHITQNKGFSNTIMLVMIILTIIIVILMFIIKMK